MKIDWHRIITLEAWVQSRKTCWDYDKALSNALRKHGVSNIGPHTCDVAGQTVWIGNYPYSYGQPYAGSYDIDAPLPSVRTRKMLRKMVAEKRIDTWSFKL